MTAIVGVLNKRVAVIFGIEDIVNMAESLISIKKSPAAHAIIGRDGWRFCGCCDDYTLGRFRLAEA